MKKPFLDLTESLKIPVVLGSSIYLDITYQLRPSPSPRYQTYKTMSADVKTEKNIAAYWSQKAATLMKAWGDGLLFAYIVSFFFVFLFFARGLWLLTVTDLLPTTYYLLVTADER